MNARLLACLRNALLGWFCAVASAQAADVVVLTYAGAMGPINASYIARGISEAEAPRQTCITKNNAAISIDFLVFWKVTKQMSAERSLRAMVTSAEGDRQAKITVADGEKQARWRKVRMAIPWPCNISRR